MHVSSPSSRSAPPLTARILAIVGIAAFLLLLVILVTGGFAFDAGPVRVSAHSWIGAASAAILLWALALAAAHGDSIRLLADLHDSLVARGPILAAVLAAGATGIGVAYGTYAASGSDASGYINQANSIAHGSL